MESREAVEEKVTLVHQAVGGDEFMPYGWGGRLCCDTCKSMECKDVCEACSYTETGDLRMPAYWPCLHEKNRVQALEYERIYALKEAERERIRNKFGFKKPKGE